MRNNTKIDPSEMRVDDLEWMQLVYDGGTVSAVILAIRNLRVSQSAGHTFIS